MKLFRLSNPLKLFLGFLTIWPIIYILLFMIYIFSYLMHVPSENIPHAFFIIFPLHILTVLIGLGVNGLFIYDLFTNDRIKGDKKALWGVVLLLGGILALPAYWYLYIRKTPSPRRKKST